MPTYLVSYDATLAFSDSILIDAESAEEAEALIEAALDNDPPAVGDLGPEHLEVVVTHVTVEDEPS
jgi:hypothetical protein